MYRWPVTLVTLTIAATLLAPAPRAAAQDAPIGRLGDTLHVEYSDPSLGDFAADVIVHDVLPVDEPPGWGWTGSPRWRAQGAPWRAGVTVHTISAPNPYALSLALVFDGVTPGADAYQPKHTDAPDQLGNLLSNAPAGATVDGGVYWDVYRDPVTNVVLLDKSTGVHLAQWNL